MFAMVRLNVTLGHGIKYRYIGFGDWHDCEFEWCIYGNLQANTTRIIYEIYVTFAPIVDGKNGLYYPLICNALVPKDSIT